MRALIAIPILLCGCTNDPFRAKHPAMIEFIGAVPGELGGIYRIDGHSAPGGIIRFEAGKRVIEFSCPGYLYTDQAPRLKARFEAGVAYAMSCEGTEPVIMVKES